MDITAKFLIAVYSKNHYNLKIKKWNETVEIQ